MPSEKGFSLIELLVATAVMLIVSGTVTSALLQMTSSQQTIWNRAEMHSGVRNATELLQQEVGQAGRVTLPNSVTFVGAVAGGGASSEVQLSSVSGMFPNQKLTVGTGATEETVTITAVNTDTTQVTAAFSHAHG